MAIVSSSPAVGARCAHGRAGVGVVATQNITDPGLAPRVLDGLQRRHSSAARRRGAGAGGYPFRRLPAIARDRPAAARRAFTPVRRALGRDGRGRRRRCGGGRQPAGPCGGSRRHGQRVRGAAADIWAIGSSRACAPDSTPAEKPGPCIRRPFSSCAMCSGRSSTCASIGATMIRWRRSAALWRRYAPQIEDYVQRALDPDRAPRVSAFPEIHKRMHAASTTSHSPSAGRCARKYGVCMQARDWLGAWNASSGFCRRRPGIHDGSSVGRNACSRSGGAPKPARPPQRRDRMRRRTR